jgi:hypothetical protein
MFLDTMVLDEEQNTYEMELTNTNYVHLICGTTGLPTGHPSDNCHPVMKFTTVTKRLALNDYDERVTDYKTETGYLITPNDEPVQAIPQLPVPSVLDQTPVYSQDIQIVQPNADDRILTTWSEITDRWHIETMGNLKFSSDEVANFRASRQGSKVCKKCGVANAVIATSCEYCN